MTEKRKSVMWQYIAEEPEVLRNMMRSPAIAELACSIGTSLEAIYFVAHGSSLNAVTAVSDFLSQVAGLRIYACTPANFCGSFSTLHYESRERTLVAAISQTGTSAGAIAAMEHAASMGFSTIGITAVEGSPVWMQADRKLLLLCGEEDSNAKTKGYSSTLLALLCLALHLGLSRGTTGEAKAAEIRREIEDMISLLPETAEHVFRWCEHSQFGRSLKDLYVLGSGMNFGTAQEGQLKLMETMCIPTMFNDIGEFSHGMHRSITSESSVILIKSGDAYGEMMEDTFQYLKKTSHVLLVDASGDGIQEEQRIVLPMFPHTQSLLLTTLVIQVLSVYAPEHMGLDPNRDAHNDFTEVVHTRV